MHHIRVIERRISAGNQFDGASGAAVGTITPVAGSALVEGEEFYLTDGRGPEVTFRFVGAFFEPTSTVRPVVFKTGNTATEMRDKIAVAINAARTLNITASVAGADVTLENRLGGTAGNRTPTPDTVADGGFVVSAMATGVDHLFSDIDGVRIYNERADGGQFDFPNLIPQAVDGITVGGTLTTVIEMVQLSCPTASSYTIQAVTPEGDVVVLEDGAPPASGALIAGPFTIGGDDRIKIITVGSTNALTARVIASQGLPLPPSMA